MIVLACSQTVLLPGVDWLHRKQAKKKQRAATSNELRSHVKGNPRENLIKWTS